MKMSSYAVIQENSDLFRTLIVLALTTIIIRFIQYLCRRRRIQGNLGEIKVVPGSLPFVGHALLFSGSPEDIFKRICEHAFEYGPNFAAWLGNTPIVVIGKPEDLETVLQSQNCIEKGFFYKFFKDIVGDGIFVAQGQKWKRNRRIVQSTLNTRIVNSFSTTFTSTSNILVEEILPTLVEKENVDWYSVVLRTNLDSIVRTTMGINLDVQRRQVEFERYLQKVTQTTFVRLTNILLHPEFIFKFSRTSKQFKEAKEYIFKFMTNVLREKKAELNQLDKNEDFIGIDDYTERKPFLQMMLEFNKKDVTFTDEGIIDEALIFITGAIDTSTVTTCFLLMILGMHQDIQQKLYEEVIDVVGQDTSPELEMLQKLEFLERCLKETMRLFAPVPFISREVKGDLSLSGGVLPVGAVLILPIFCTHRSTNYWENSLKFNPDRFLTGKSTERHPYSFLPFSAGLRGCVGMSYAFTNMKIIFSQIIRKYRIECDYRNIEDINLTSDIALRPVDGFKIRLEHRV